MALGQPTAELLYGAVGFLAAGAGAILMGWGLDLGSTGRLVLLGMVLVITLCSALAGRLRQDDSPETTTLLDRTELRRAEDLSL